MNLACVPWLGTNSRKSSERFVYPERTTDDIIDKYPRTVALEANMAENENNATQEQVGGDSSASGGACCSAGSGAGWKSWKTVAFILILLAAAALAGRSLLTNGRCGGAAAPGGSGSSCGGCPFSFCSKEPAACSQQEACCEDKEKQNPGCCPLIQQSEDAPSGCSEAPAPCCGQPGS
jgi:hypothetical protein